ncbi:hypothetical protein [Actinomycetospora soli]|uniref:hypothetical protein n=1 Tax=Actinomycetospora soli TaxID=2893887 RepID=UPI001E465770|nr:hypothetical protein [Actinomycetospora soli]MCD2185665.1 hypothetical protein [Actinomycetospora soli]
MTTATTTPALPARLALGAGALLLMWTADVVGLLIGPEHRVDGGDLVGIAVMTAVAVAAWAVVLLLAREPDAGNRSATGAVVIGALGSLGCVVFWTGVPLVLGIGAVLLGRLATTRAEQGAGRGRLARAGLALGVLALVLWLGAFVFVQDW